MRSTSHTLCSFCEASCGIVVEHEEGRVLAIRGDKEDVLSRGHICPKAVALGDLHHDPERLRKPMRRVGKEWVEISWQEAMNHAADGLGGIQKKHGPSAVGMYFGNPIGHNYAALLALVPFVKALGTRNVFSSNSLDGFPRTLASLLLYGNQALLPVPDLARTDLLVIMGANPVISNGSIMTAPDCARRLKELRARGGRLIVIDPRRTETAELADEHLFIRPGSDAALLLSIMNVVFSRGLVSLGDLEQRVDGLERLREIADGFSPQRVASFTGISAENIEALARSLAHAPRAAIYGRMGTCTQAFGTLSSWGIDAVNILTGHMDVAGGAMFSTAAVDLAGLARAVGQAGDFGRWKSRVDGYSEFNGELPFAALANEIVTPGKGQMRGLITLAGNPVLSAPNGRRTDEALGSLDFMVAIDCYINETTRHANVILPPVSHLERDHYPLLEYGMSVRNVAHYSAAVFEPGPEARHDWQIMLELGNAIARRRSVFSGASSALTRTAITRLEPRRILDLLLRMGPFSLSLKKLAGAPHGLDLGPLRPVLAKHLRRAKVQLLPDLVGEDIARLQAAIDDYREPGEELLLISRRTLPSVNSWMHNSPRLVRGKNRCKLQINPADAKEREIVDGAMVIVRTATGEIALPAEVTEEMMPGVVTMPYGWGHDREGAWLSIARKHAGVSMNDVLHEGEVDRVSGVSVLNGIRVRVLATGN